MSEKHSIASRKRMKKIPAKKLSKIMSDKAKRRWRLWRKEQDNLIKIKV